MPRKVKTVAAESNRMRWRKEIRPTLHHGRPLGLTAPSWNNIAAVQQNTVCYNVLSTIGKAPVYFFKGGSLHNRKFQAQLSPQIIETDQNHSTTIK